jgi:hypothetical protein
MPAALFGARRMTTGCGTDVLGPDAATEGLFLRGVTGDRPLPPDRPARRPTAGRLPHGRAHRGHGGGPGGRRVLIGKWSPAGHVVVMLPR